MATTTTNSTPTSIVNPLLTGPGRYLIDGTKWGGPLGSGVTLTYSFPGSVAYHATPYGEYFHAGEWLGLQSLATGERAAVRNALEAWSAVAGVVFAEVPDTSMSVGEFRIAYTTYDTAAEYGHAYLPHDLPAAGDVWLSYSNWNPTSAATVAKGGEDFHTLLHEIGHSLGLKHSFNAPNAIPAAYDNFFYTVMSYSARISGDSGTASFLPTTPMYYDLVAIQALYGRNTAHNSGDTAYTFNEGQFYFQTIDDAGGRDRIVYNGSQAVVINLAEGKFSSLSAPITFDNGSSKNTVAIGPSTVIELAIGGEGNDTLNGNIAANTVYGRGGADQLAGGAGNDVLSGGNGNDRLFGASGRDTLIGGSGSDNFYFTTPLSPTGDIDRISDFNHSADTIYLAKAAFSALGRGILHSGSFAVGSTALDAGDRILFNKIDGSLFYDADGTGGAAAIKFATVSAGANLNATDFIIY